MLIFSFRYEFYWLPLLQRLSRDGIEAEAVSSLRPSADVHWMWQVHMLAADSYLSDCATLFGQHFDHRYSIDTSTTAL
jgi:hypothetical protein